MLLDPTGRAVDARWLVAAEWLGIVTHGDATEMQIRFVPGGVSHALDPIENSVLCGADPEQLEAFAIDFTQNEWSFRCPVCQQRVLAPDPA
jgi:hypothetical protein